MSEHFLPIAIKWQLLPEQLPGAVFRAGLRDELRVELPTGDVWRQQRVAGESLLGVQVPGVFGVLWADQFDLFDLQCDVFPLEF